MGTTVSDGAKKSRKMGGLGGVGREMGKKTREGVENSGFLEPLVSVETYSYRPVVSFIRHTQPPSTRCYWRFGVVRLFSGWVVQKRATHTGGGGLLAGKPANRPVFTPMHT